MPANHVTDDGKFYIHKGESPMSVDFDDDSDSQIAVAFKIPNGRFLVASGPSGPFSGFLRNVVGIVDRAVNAENDDDLTDDEKRLRVELGL